jgi:uncharacterized membrane protein
MHRTAWVLQILLAVYFVATGLIHFVVPEGLPGPMEWMYDLSTPVHVIAGIAEIAGGLGLVLPAATRIAPRLTPLAAAGLVVIMASAAGWHATRGETQSIAGNVVTAALLIFIIYVRTRVHPIEARDAVA